MKQWSAKELAEKTGIATSNLSAIENGDRVPKWDICGKIAKALNVDPVEICGIELSRDDEIRLLMKLLSKYALDVNIQSEIVDGKEVKNANLKTEVTLPFDFADFAIRFRENKEAIADAVEDINTDDPRYELVKANAEDKFHYWLETYPEVDAISIAEKNLTKGNYPDSDNPELNESRANGIIDSDLLDIFSSIADTYMQSNFYIYQTQYVIPKRKADWKSRYTNIK